IDVIDLPGPHDRFLAAIFELRYVDGDPEQYVVPLGFATGEPAIHLEQSSPGAVVADLVIAGAGTRGVLYDALATGEAAAAILQLARDGASVRGRAGELRARSLPSLAELSQEAVPRVQLF